MSTRLWRAQNAEWLRLSLRRLRLQLQRHAASPERAWLLAGDGPEPPPAATGELDGEIRAVESEMGDTAPALLSLAGLLELTRFETDLLLLAAAPSLDATFSRAYAELQDDARLEHATLQLALLLFVSSRVDRVLAVDSLMPVRPLRALYVIDVEGTGAAPLPHRALVVDERMTDFLRGVNRMDSRVASLLHRVTAVPETQLDDDVVRELADRVSDSAGAAIVNLVGASGDSRELAARVCAALGLQLHELDPPHLAEHPPHERERLVRLLAREAVLAGIAVHVDAGELERASAMAGTITELTRLPAGALFLASRERWPLASRGHVVEVVRPTRGRQADLWREALSRHAHSLNGEVDAIVQQFELSAAEIADAVERAAARSDGAITAGALWRSCREGSSTALDELARRIVPVYGWDDIVVSDDIRSQLRELAGQVEQRGRVYETWGFGEQLVRGRGITALFTGASGVGKTMAAEILAGHLDLDLHRIDLSGVISKWVGETPKNVRRIFEAAERSGSILFFDEADALFGKRTEVRDSHDRYANVEIDYLLQRMEDYSGLAVLATNRRDALDVAFLRRLRFVIEFPFPGLEERRQIWERVFPANAELDGIEYTFLSQLELSGGSIRAIAVNAAFLAAADGAPIRMAHIVRSAAREYAKLSKPVTSAEFGPYHELVRT